MYNQGSLQTQDRTKQLNNDLIILLGDLKMYEAKNELGLPDLFGGITPCGGVEGDDRDTPS